LLIIDQSTNNKTKKTIKKYQNRLTIIYHRLKKKGISLARNFAIKKAKGEIIAFTDDDCIADKNWLKQINQSFKKYKNINLIFGQTLPFRPEKNKGLICPSIFTKKTIKIIQQPCVHYKNIGFGNNMAFRKKIFNQIGVFKTWLGIGSIGKSADDAELAIRALIKGNKILYKPDIKIYHNRWLTIKQYKNLELTYNCGEMACYGYFAFQKYNFANKLVKDNLMHFLRNCQQTVISVFKFKKNSFVNFRDLTKEFIFKLKGIIIAFYFYQFDPLVR
jgi:glycosyltransferase involved in cell wall biosynthesis